MMDNIKKEAIAPSMKKNHQAKSLKSDKCDRVQSKRAQANARMKAANTLAEQSEQLSERVLELLRNQFEHYYLFSLATPYEQIQWMEEDAQDYTLQNIQSCIELMIECLIDGNCEPIAVNLISEFTENPEAFCLSVDGLIAVFNWLRENHGLTDQARDAANEYIEKAIAALSQLAQTEESSQLKTPEKSEILTLEEIQERYPQQWVLIAYTERDEYLNVIQGEVLAYSPDCDEIDNYLPYTKGKAVAIEYTGPIPETIGIWM